MSLRVQRDKASLRWLFALFVILPLTLVFGHRGVAPWLLLASFPAFLRGDFWQSSYGAVFDRLNFREPLFLGFAAALFFCFWIGVSAIWSPKQQPDLALYLLGPLLVGASVIWFALHLSSVWAHRLAIAFSLSVMASVGVLAFEGVSDGLLRGLIPPEDTSPGGSRDMIALGRGVTAIIPAIFPAAIIIRMVSNRLAALALLALAAVASVMTGIHANMAAIAIGAIAAYAAAKAPTSLIRITGWGIIIGLLVSPFIAFMPVESFYDRFGDALPASWNYRLTLWQAGAAAIPEGLPLGHGADAVRSWHAGAPLAVIPGMPNPAPIYAMHPHNIFLQVWLETGLPGVLAFAAFIWAGMRILAAEGLSKGVSAALVGAVAAFFATVMADGSFWHVWRYAAAALAGMGVAFVFSFERAVKKR